MRLSEAIRFGAFMKPQIYGTVANNGGTCAWGAAWDAVGKLQELREGVLVERSKAIFPLGHVYAGPCPECGELKGYNKPGVVINNITHLNDDHKWTREQIADWVETIEVKLETLNVNPVENTIAVEISHV